MIQFTVHGVPVPEGRPRHKLLGRWMQVGRQKVLANPKIITYKPTESEQWCKTVKQMAMRGRPSSLMTGSLELWCIFYMPRPKSKPLHRFPDHIYKPDLDNLVKSIKDAMEGVVYHNDSQITVEHIQKLYADDGLPRVIVRVKPSRREQ